MKIAIIVCLLLSLTFCQFSYKTSVELVENNCMVSGEVDSLVAIPTDFTFDVLIGKCTDTSATGPDTIAPGEKLV